ncbi:hypothetical protein [Halorubrum sodomense]|nr:hypothetical protein [Halorubrum sodomense]
MLFPLLQFVALVAPAIAILMQVLEEKDGRTSFALSLLEVALLAMIFGSLILLVELLGTIENTLTVGSVLLINGSLLLAAVAVAWNSLNLSEKFSGTTGTSPNFRTVTVQILEIGLVLSLVITMNILGFFVFAEYLPWLVNVGPIFSSEIIDPSLYYSIIFVFLTLRVVVYLANVGKIPVSDLQDSVSESLGYAVAFIVLFPALGFGLFAIFQLLIHNPWITVARGNDVFILPHLWALFVLVALFAGNMDDEEDEEDQDGGNSESGS